MTGPAAIEVSDLAKTFRIPEHRVDTLKERAVHPFRRNEFRELKALDGVSFEVGDGEFFGVIGRNGSGKSTLLKILASIYGADAGSVRVAGRIAAFIELGVGFDMEMSARQNIVLTGVLLGLSRQRAEELVPAVIEFAELEEFAELKVKNYSAGMLVRLAFSSMIKVDADVLLVDEILAVGDAAFQQKCETVFEDLRRIGKTIVLVTHDMGLVERFCDRAMLIDDGRIDRIGDTDEVTKAYLRVNFRGKDGRPGAQPKAEDGAHSAFVAESWIDYEDGERVVDVERGRPFRLNMVIEATEPIRSPIFTFVVTGGSGVAAFSFGRRLNQTPGLPDDMAAGDRLLVSAPVENRLVPGRYFVNAYAYRNNAIRDIGMEVLHAIDFSVFGTNRLPGVVSLVDEVEITESGSGDGPNGDPEA
ncbi:MAG: ABC transporter ATP-binding protein [Solirubrobacterales bacterium]|nr:ABC transporter ATP-binding protein [Solirubrobacterales bacterium]